MLGPNEGVDKFWLLSVFTQTDLSRSKIPKNSFLLVVNELRFSVHYLEIHLTSLLFNYDMLSAKNGCNGLH